MVACITFIRLPHKPLNSCQILSLWSPALHSSDCRTNHSTPARYWVCGHLHYIHQTAAQTTQLLPDNESVVACITFIRLLHKPLNSCQIMSLWSPALHSSDPLNSCQIMSLWSPALHSSDCCTNHSTPARYWVCGHLHYIHQTAAQTTQLLPDNESVVTCITFIRLCRTNHSLLPDNESVVTCITFIRLPHKPLNSCQIMSLWSLALHSSDCRTNHSTPAR